MSGGVDSSVAAFLTKQQGLDCAGITMKLFDNEDIGVSSKKSCCSLEDAKEARNTADLLGIPHYINNFTSEFRKQVIKRFIVG